MSQLNINQFAQVPIRGQLDMRVSLGNGVLQCEVSANNGATAINAGDAVDLDSAITVAGLPQVITALYTDSSFGYAVYDVRQSSQGTPAIIQVATSYAGPVVWLVAGGTLSPGSFVEQYNGSTYDVVAYGTSSNKIRGVVLDYATIGALTRIILLNKQYTA